jgi:hypothetical protein
MQGCHEQQECCMCLLHHSMHVTDMVPHMLSQDVLQAACVASIAVASVHSLLCHCVAMLAY